MPAKTIIQQKEDEKYKTKSNRKGNDNDDSSPALVIHHVRTTTTPSPTIRPLTTPDADNSHESVEHEKKDEKKENNVVEDTSQSSLESAETLENYIQDNSLNVVKDPNVNSDVQKEENAVIHNNEVAIETTVDEEESLHATNDGNDSDSDNTSPQSSKDSIREQFPEELAADDTQVEDDQEPTNVVTVIEEDIPQVIDDGSSNSENTTPQSSLDFIRQHFPECISETGIIDLRTAGKYEAVLPNTQPRYDHFSCYLMKARYNCAHPPDYDKPEASDYELVLYLGYDNNTKPCRLRSLVDALGGPSGLAQRPTPTSDTLTNAPTRIALHGSSYVRQMWEAMACGFREDITQLVVKQPKPDVSLSAMERRNHAPIEFSEIGKPIRNMEWVKNGRCHGVYKNELAAYYRAGVPRVPGDTIDGCNDSIAMVRFQESVEVFYVFRPNDFSTDALNRIYSDFFQLTSINGASSESPAILFNALVWNVGLEKPENILPDGVQAKQEIGVDAWLEILRASQRRDLGVYYGADNPWITKPPDGHPCMPGIPDDEVNLILYVLYTGYNIN